MERTGGPEGNELLTTTVAALLVVMLVALGITVIHMGGLRRVHMELGLLLIPPILLKLTSTGYRFARYYTRSGPYRIKGPPVMAMRVLAPVLVAATLAVFASGIALLVDGHKVGWVLELHKVSFIVWGAVFGVHFLVYAPRVARSLLHDWTASRRAAVPGAGVRAMLVATALGAGLALMVALIPTVDRWHA